MQLEHTHEGILPAVVHRYDRVSAHYGHSYCSLPASDDFLNVSAQVFSGSGAEALDIQTGDILLSLDGKSVSDGDDVTQILYKKSIGDTLTAILYRSGKRYELTLTVEENVWN